MPTPELGIQDLLATPAAERTARVMAQPDPSAAVAALAEEAEKLGQSSGGRAVEGIRAARDAARAMEPVAVIAVRGRLARALSHALAAAGDFAGALDEASAAIQEANAADSPTELARARLATMQPLLKLGRPTDAAEAGRLAAVALDAAGEKSLAARARVNTANVLKALGQAKEAVEELNRALSTEGSNPAFAVVAQNTRGEALIQLGEFELSRQAFSSALAAASTGEESFPSAMVRSNLADLDARIGRSQAALVGYEAARRVFSALHAEGQLLRIAIEEAELFAALGAIAEATRGFKSALPSVEKRSMAFEHARALSGLALVEAIRVPRHPTELVASHERAYRAWRDLGNSYEAARIGARFAEVLAESGELERAEGHLQQAECQLSDSALDQLVLVGARAACAEAAGRDDEARKCLADAELAAASTQLSPAAASIAARAARLERRRGDYNRAVACARRAIAHVERARTAVNAERLRQSILGARVDAFEELVLALMARGGAGDCEHALDTVTRAKSRSLLERVLAGSEQIRREAGEEDASIREQRDALVERLNALYRQMGSGGSAGERDIVARAVARDIAVVERELEALDVRAPGLAETQLPPLWDQSRQTLADDDAMIEYFVAHGEIMAFVGRRDGPLLSRRLNMRMEEASLHARRIQFQVRRSFRGERDAASELQTHLRELGAALLQPLIDTCPSAQRWIVAPHGALHGLPFGAFVLRDGASLGERGAVVVVPSGSLLGALAAPSPRDDTHRALVVGVADEFAPLIEREAVEVAEVLGVQPLLGNDATIERVLSELERCEVAHLACHGLYLSGAARSSGLRLADGWLTVRHIEALRRGPRTVVLSGCETGRSLFSPGDEHLGLVRAFVDRGARTVVATLWVAHDAASREMMVDYHQSRAITSCGTDAEALRKAQRTLRGREPDPARWAPFFVTGGLH